MLFSEFKIKKMSEQPSTLDSGEPAINETTEATTTQHESSSVPPVQKRKLTDEEKREILRRRRLEKIKGNSESRMNKLLYGDTIPSSTPSEQEVTESPKNPESFNNPTESTNP